MQVVGYSILAKPICIANEIPGARRGEKPLTWQALSADATVSLQFTVRHGSPTRKWEASSKSSWSSHAILYTCADVYISLSIGFKSSKHPSARNVKQTHIFCQLIAGGHAHSVTRLFSLPWLLGKPYPNGNSVIAKLIPPLSLVLLQKDPGMEQGHPWMNTSETPPKDSADSSRLHVSLTKLEQRCGANDATCSSSPTTAAADAEMDKPASEEQRLSSKRQKHSQHAAALGPLQYGSPASAAVPGSRTFPFHAEQQASSAATTCVTHPAGPPSPAIALSSAQQLEQVGPSAVLDQQASAAATASPSAAPASPSDLAVAHDGTLQPEQLAASTVLGSPATPFQARHEAAVAPIGAFTASRVSSGCSGDDQVTKHMSPTGVTCQLHCRAFVVPAASKQPDLWAIPSLCPAVLMLWMQKLGIFPEHGLHPDLLGFPCWQEGSFNDKERTDLLAFLTALCIHSRCLGLKTVRLCDVWAGQVPMAAQIAMLRLALPEGGWDKWSRATKLTTKVQIPLSACDTP